jgi:uncharacterized protein (TIGR03083 family)
MSSGTHGGRIGVTPDAAQAAVRAERLHLADLLDDLSPSDWDEPSLCDAWSVHDVAAHLTTTTQETPWEVLRELVRARFDFDRMTRDVASRLAATYSPNETVARLRESADSSRRVVLSSPMDPLMDLVVHAQDIARPLGRDYSSPTEVVVACATYLAGNRLMGGPPRTCCSPSPADLWGSPASPAMVCRCWSPD